MTSETWPADHMWVLRLINTANWHYLLLSNDMRFFKSSFNDRGWKGYELWIRKNSRGNATNKRTNSWLKYSLFLYIFFVNLQISLIKKETFTTYWGINYKFPWTNQRWKTPFFVLFFQSLVVNLVILKWCFAELNFLKNISLNI